MTGRDIAAAIEEIAPLALQEGFDNSGWQLGNPDATVTAALICVDVTPDVVAEAAARGCGLIVSHHPLLFRGLKRITGETQVQRTVIDAIRHGISVYSAHTNLDKAPAYWGVSAKIADMLGLVNIKPLLPDPTVPGAGLGAIGTLPAPMLPRDLANQAARRLGSVAPRMSNPHALAPDTKITRVAVCGGSGSSVIGDAIAAGADALVTADLTYHTMLDYAADILLVDCGHRETEDCTKDLIAQIISRKFPSFATLLSDCDRNPVADPLLSPDIYNYET